jgi:hypothetical protein
MRNLPATISSATTITAVSVSATATASPTATAAATTTAKAAATTSATGSPTATTAAFTRRPGFVHHNVAAHEIMAVQSLDGSLGFIIAVDLDKPESARLP